MRESVVPLGVVYGREGLLYNLAQTAACRAGYTVGYGIGLQIADSAGFSDLHCIIIDTTHFHRSKQLLQATKCNMPQRCFYIL